MSAGIPYIFAIALFMESLDATIILTALPSIATDLAVTPLALKFAVTGYLLSLALFIPMSGWAARVYGSKKIFLLAVMIFILGSCICGMTPNLSLLMLGRLIQGFGGSMMLPVAMLIMLDTIVHDRLAQVMSYVTIPGLLGPMLGPLLGGWIVTYFSWRMIFFVNIPIGLLGIWFASVTMLSDPPCQKQFFDWRGFILFSGATLAMLGIIESLGTSYMQYSLELGLCILFVAFLWSYIRHAQLSEIALIHLDLFSQPKFNYFVICFGIFVAAVSGLGLINPMFLQLGLNLSPLITGQLLMSYGMGLIVAKPINAIVIQRLGEFFWMSMNYILIIMAILMMSVYMQVKSPFWSILALLFCQGYGISTLFTNLNVLLYRDIPYDMRSHATAFVSLAIKLSICLGVALAGTVLACYVGDQTIYSAHSFRLTYVFLLGEMALSYGIVLRIYCPK